MIERQELKHYKIIKGEYGADDDIRLVKTFRGRISKSSKVSFAEGKQVSSIVPKLMCDYDIKFNSGDIIQDTDLARYTITDAHQPNGVAGVKPKTFKARQVIVLEKRNG